MKFNTSEILMVREIIRVCSVFVTHSFISVAFDGDVVSFRLVGT